MAIFGSYVADRAAQWRGAGPRWRNINGNTGNNVWVECQADAGMHGDGVNLTKLWAADAGQGPWTANSAQADRPGLRTMPTAATCSTPRNYINWLDNASTITQSRIEIVKQVATNTIAQLAVDDQVNVGLMQFSNNTERRLRHDRHLRRRHGAA